MYLNIIIYHTIIGFHLRAFYKELFISACDFYFLEVRFFSIRDWCYWKINRSSCHGWKGLWYIYTYISLHNTAHISVMYFLWLLINIFVSFLYPCVSWVECFSTYDEINCSFFSGSSSVHWPDFWPRREGGYRELGEGWSKKAPSRGDTITWVL